MNLESLCILFGCGVLFIGMMWLLVYSIHCLFSPLLKPLPPLPIKKGEYRVGRKSSTVILDYRGVVVAKCEEGQEDLAKAICESLNKN